MPHVFVNRVLWPEMDTASRSIEPGDYIRLQVKTERAQFCDLILVETNARRQRIWESSSEESQPPDDFASEESESEEQSRYPRRSRSRSRERPRRNQRGDSSSLLQVSMIRLNKRTFDDYPQKDFDAIAAFDDVCETSSHPIATATLPRTTFSTTSDSPLWRLATPKIVWVFAVLQVRVLTCLSTLAGSASCWHSHPSFSNTDAPEDGNGPVHWFGVVPEALFGGSYSGYVLERQYMRSLFDISWYALCTSGDPPIWDVDAIFAELPLCDIRTDCWIRDYPNCPWNGNRAHLDGNEAPIFGIGDMRPDACGQPCAVHGKVLPYYLSLNASFAYLRPPGNGPGNVGLETLDDIIYLGQFQIVVDYRGPEPVHDLDPRHPHHNDGVEVPDEASSTFLNLVHGDCRSQAVDELPDLPWHETTQNLLEARATFGDIPLTEDVYIYTDGSAGTLYNGQEYEYYPWASWAFVIWWKQPQGWRILAYDFGHVTNDVNDPSWTGANQLTSAEGERAALLAAVCCLLRSGIHGLLHFYFDATAAGFGASGQWHSPPNAKDAKLLRAAMQLLEITQQEAPTFNHVKAHTGDAMNEMVDTLAYNAYINAIANPVLDFDVRSVLKGARMYCELWPLILMAARSDSRFPSWESNTGSLHWSTHTKPPRADIVWASQDDHDCRTTVSREIRLVTYNVRTLGDGVGMAAMLRRQFASQEIDIACLQETRAKRSQIISSQDYTRFISKADEEGRGGVEIWVRKFGGKKKPLITGHNYLILGVNPEWLLLQLQIEGTTLHVASAHAPHSGHQAEEHETWWKNFTDAIITKIGIAPLIVGIDANSNFTESIDGTVGGLGVHWRSNKGLPHFTAFLKDVDMWIPATYTECHYGPTGTWRHPATGQWHRNDYLAISHCLQARECMTWVDGNIDCGGANVDHLAVVLQFQWEVVLKARTVKKNKRIDTLAMRHAGPERLAAALASVPVLPWDLNIHEHAAIFGDALREALAMAFPCSRKPPYREYISEEAWGLRGRRCQVRRRIYYRHGVEKRSDLGTAFSVLKGTANYDVLRRAGLRWELQCILADMRDRLQLRTLNHALKQQLKKDRTKYCDEIAASCESLPPSQVLQRLHAIGVRGKARRKNATETVTMKDEHGRDVLSIDELNDLWRRHFEGLEDGFLIQKDELLQQCYDAQQKRPVPKPAFAEIPTLSDLETALRLNKWGKSAAFDNLPTDACHRFPQLIARVAYPLLVKQALMIAEPIGYKGGVLVHAFKGKGAASQCSNYRALMISSVMAKANHRILRSDLIGKFERYALPLQVGGLPGRAVAQGAQCLVAFGSACRQQGKSSAVLFVDVRQAFYRMLRSHVVDIKRLDESVARLFQTLRLPKTSFADFAHELTHDSAVQQAEISEFLQAHLTESVSHTWFRLPNDPRISQTRKGSRPGDNLADLLFSFSFRRILAAVVQQLGEQGIDLSFESCGRAHPFPAQGPQEEDIRFHTLGPVWADDLAVFVWSDEACSLLDKTATVAASLFDALALRGMDVNFEAGKTEIVAHFTGKLAHSVKREVYRHKEPVLEVTTQWLDKVYVRIAPTYKHLGTVFSTAGRMKAEIRQRLGHARHEFRRFRKQVYANPLLEINKRIALFSSLVLSGLLFDISIWPRLDVRDEKIFDQGLNSLYRSLAYALWGDEVFQWRNERMRAKLGLSTSSTLLRTARLRHLQHLCTKGDKYVWAFVHLDGDWLRMIQDDLEWMRKQIPLHLPQSSPTEEWQPWRDDMDMGRRWRNNVRQAQLHEDLQRAKRSDWLEWHRQILKVLQEEQLWRDYTLVEHVAMHGCLRCRKCFRSDQAWSVHAFRSHGRRTAARRFASGNTCVACLKNFSLHSRLINHLRYSVKCRNELARQGITAAPEPSIGSREEVKQHVRRRDIPALRSLGPLQQPLTEAAPREFDLNELAFAEDVLDFIEYANDFSPTVDYGVQVIWETFQRSIVRPRDLRLLLIRVVAEYENTLGEDEDEIKLRDYLEEILSEVARLWNGKWLMGHLRYEELQQEGQGTLDAIAEINKLEKEGRFPKRIQRPLHSRQLIFLHLFSGHRRSGDVQEAVEAFAEKNGMAAKALSVDIAIHAHHGDILRPETQQKFVHAIRTGLISGFVAGPPCETWSKARENKLDLESGGQGPRPLRSVETPEGLETLKVRELKQVLIGNRLLGVAALLAFHSWVVGIFALLEHPMLPDNDHSPSIWRLAVVRLLCKQVDVVKVTVRQGLFGAKSSKPTDLMIVRPPRNYQQILDKHQTRSRVPVMHAIGLQEDGSFHTTSLKVYPPALCSAMAELWGAHILERDCPPSFDEVTITDFEEVVNALHSQVGVSVQGPDYCPNGQYAAV